MSWTVSVRGVLLWGDRVALVHTERDEWELPGGQLERGETPKECVEREIAEELFVTARAVQILDSWVYEVLPGVHVLIITFGCEADEPDQLRHSDEHDGVGLHPVDQLDSLIMPEGYRSSVRAWHAARMSA